MDYFFTALTDGESVQHNDDGSTRHVRYRCVDSTRCVVFGDPNAAARQILDRLGATYHTPWGGFSRF